MSPSETSIAATGPPVDRDERRTATGPRRPLSRRGSVLAGIVLVALAGAIVIALELTGAAQRATPAPERGLDVLPFPGTPDASTRSEIGFPALNPSQLKAVSVLGSRSGDHTGQLVALPAGGGSAFVPEHPFTAGEAVSVNAALSSPAAGAASGAPNTSRLRFAFTVATPGTASASANAPAAKPPATQSFHSQPNLRPPIVTISASNPDVGSGETFVSVQNGAQNGPMILNSQGRLVWFQPTSGGAAAFDFQVQSYQDKPVLTWWQGKVVGGHGTDGEDFVLNTSYHTVAVVHAGDGYSSDLHEFQLTPRGTALVSAYQPVETDLSSVGGARDGTVLDSIVQEVDIKTGRVLWEWHPLGHVPLSASYAGKPIAGSQYDYFHLNSIQQLPNGNLLVSARNTWTVYEISRKTGKIVWQLGGKHSSFKMGEGTQFEWQHDARVQPDGTLTLFDDASSPQEASQSRGIHLSLDTTTMHATLLHSYTHTPSLLAGSQGNMQILPNGNVLVGWGAEPDFSEYTPAGRQIFNGSFTLPVQSYRAYRSAWSAQPSEPPAISVSISSTRALTVYASWNGATNVARFQLLAGPSKRKLSPVSTAARSEFETAIPATTSEPYVSVRALDSSGRVLGTSAAISR